MKSEELYNQRLAFIIKSFYLDSQKSFYDFTTFRWYKSFINAHSENSKIGVATITDYFLFFKHLIVEYEKSEES